MHASLGDPLMLTLERIAGADTNCNLIYNLKLKTDNDNNDNKEVTGWIIDGQLPIDT